MSTTEAQVSFNIKRPIRTRCGWPARIIGVLQRRTNPYVVAIWNPNFKSEEMHVYGSDGRFPTETREHPLDLVELPDDDYWEWAAPGDNKDTRPVHAYVTKEPSWPVNGNSMHLDTMSMGTHLVRGWELLHEGYDNKESPRPLTWIKLYNTRTGDVFKLHFTPIDDRELGVNNGS